MTSQAIASHFRSGRGEQSEEERRVFANGANTIILDLANNNVIIPDTWRDKWRKRISLLILIIFAISVTLTGIGIIDMLHKQHSNFHNSQNDDTKISETPSEAPSTIYEQELNVAFKKYFGDEGNVAFEVNTSQWKARLWMVEKDDPSMLTSILEQENKTWIMIQRYALLTIFFEFGGFISKKIDWLTMPECQSKLILCDNNGRVVSLELGECIMLKYNIP